MKNYNIGKKFTISLVLFLILPLTILFLWINNSMIERIKKENLKTNLETLKQTQTSINYLIQDLSYVSMQVIGNDNLQKYITTTESKEVQQQRLQTCRFDLEQLLSQKEYITRMAIWNNDERILQIGAYLDGAERNIPSEVKEKKGKIVWKEATIEQDYVSSYDRIYEVSMIRAIMKMYALNEIGGYLRINIEENYVESLYKNVKNPETIGLFIVNQKGEIVSSIDKTLLGTNIKEDSYFGEIREKEEGYFQWKKKQYVTFCKIKEADWYLVKIDDKGVFREEKYLDFIMVCCMGFVLLFGVIFYVIQKKHIINPLIYLSENVSRFHEGAYDIAMYTNAKDEIGILNDSFVKMSVYIEELIEKVYKSQLKEKEAQLNYLQSQINPHFLYNTLDSMRWMAIKEKQYELAEQIEALANLFKHALNQGKEMTTVKAEIEHLKNYLLIQKNKYGDRLITTIQADDSLLECPVLNLILQPLVENSIIHGISKKIGVSNIKITIYKEKKELFYCVEDDGLGTNQQRIRDILQSEDASQNALALDNINKRIQLKYGENYGISFYSKVGIGTKVIVEIPLQEEQLI